MVSDDPELDLALRPLTGANLYRDNIFRITGLPADASAVQIRRRREEVALAAKLGTPIAPGGGDLPRVPAPDADTTRAAFESLRSPTVRLTHELLWLWRNDSEHDETIRAHCTALEAEYAVAPLEPGHPDAARLDTLWRKALNSWHALLEADDLWEWARERVREIDDARLTTGTVRRLRMRLPAHLVSVSAALAVRAAEVSPAAADRHLEFLDDSPFDEDLVDRALRDAVRPTEERVRAACDSTEQTMSASSAAAAQAGRDLLTQSGPLLRVVAGVLGPDDPVTGALHDQVASVVNRCAVVCDRDTSDSAGTLELLRAAAGLARERSTIDLIESNLGTIGTGKLVNVLLPMCERGQVERAGAILRAVRRRAPDPQLREQARRILADDYGVVGRMLGVPGQGSLFGWGTYVYGRRSPRADGKYIGTRFLTAFFIPVMPMASYVRDAAYFYGKARLSLPMLWWRRIMSVLVVLLVVRLPLGLEVALWAAAAYTVLGMITMLVREVGAPALVLRQANGGS
jgi:hypothetical protein